MPALRRVHCGMITGGDMAILSSLAHACVLHVGTLLSAGAAPKPTSRRHALLYARAPARRAQQQGQQRQQQHAGGHMSPQRPGVVSELDAKHRHGVVCAPPGHLRRYHPGMAARMSIPCTRYYIRQGLGLVSSTSLKLMVLLWPSEGRRPCSGGSSRRRASRCPCHHRGTVRPLNARRTKSASRRTQVPR